MTAVPTTAAELRRAFLEFFEERGHTVVPSSPLVPHGDPTLLFTTAGMVQFKPYYSATGDVPYNGRATSVQKSLRLTDIENVGLTPRHDTFFEMLGNFSFGREPGSYFKEEAIAFAWEFVTKVLGLPRERLYASVFAGEGKLPRDDEAVGLWKRVGLPESRIVALGRKDNFWGPAGGRGACGPCSEIYFDLGEQRPAYLPADAFWGEAPGDAGDRYMEFWNLVFPQFDAQADGTLELLPRPGIDTGMGLERLALILQGRTSIFETDVFAPLVDEVLAQAGRAARGPADLRDARIVADHVRALTFAVAEGALPGNEGAGYVLRRLLRRAVTRGRSRQGLAIHRTFLAPIAARAVEIFGGHYAELVQHRDRVLRLLEQEEAGFVETFEAGLARLEELLGAGTQEIAGADAFMLHDTYGFPVELTEEIAAARGVRVDLPGFERAMEEQRARARAASKFFKMGADAEAGEWRGAYAGEDSVFIGYELAAVPQGGLQRELRRWRTISEEEAEFVFDKTPCYPESGGQVGDRGEVVGATFRADLVRVYREDSSIVHRVHLESGTMDEMIRSITAGQFRILVDTCARRETMRNHTGTHLLHSSLRHVLGDHVRQAGSLVAPNRLRFDYTHFEAPTKELLERVEHRVNEWTLAARRVQTEETGIEQARAKGAMMLFGEKYGSVVRMVTVDGVEEAGIEESRELCGGTHVSNTGEVGAFCILSDEAIASGVRRIEAATGHWALFFLKERSALLEHAAGLLQTAPAGLPEQIEKLRGEVERLRREQAEARKGGLEAEMESLAANATVAPGGRWAVAEVRSEADTNAVREAADQLRGRLGRGAAVLALQGGGKLTFLAAVTDDLVKEKKLNAAELVKRVAQVTGGSGGGKPHLALAGGKDVTKLEAALDEARRLLAEALAS